MSIVASGFRQSRSVWMSTACYPSASWTRSSRRATLALSVPPGASKATLRPAASGLTLPPALERVLNGRRHEVGGWGRRPASGGLPV